MVYVALHLRGFHRRYNHRRDNRVCDVLLS